MRGSWKGAEALTVQVDWPLVFSRSGLILKAALADFGPVCLLRTRSQMMLRKGRLVRVLEESWPQFSGCYLYYPSRRQPSRAFAVLVCALRQCN